MNEAAARAWLESELNVSRETFEQLERFIAFLKLEAESQNLIAASTFDSIWTRHIVDSAQLLKLLPAEHQGNWLDLGSGAGFPGLVAAILTNYPVTLVESRARRIDYLQRAVQMLDLEKQVEIAGMALEKVKTAQYSVISARAFAPLMRLLDGAARFSTENTCWLLPKGKNAVKELDEVKDIWAVDFQIIPSLTDAEAGILTGKLRGNTPKNPGKKPGKR
jgi:16S rRNA (guanine527-N7)-methyltransferase